MRSLPQPLPSSSAQSLAQSESVLQESFSRLSLSPPSPTPSLMGGASSLFARPAHQRRLWPPQERDEDDVDVHDGLVGRGVSALPSASVSGGGNGSGNGRQVSDRQRQQMQYTENLSPSPLEEPHEEATQQLPAADATNISAAVDSNPLSAAFLYVYSLVTTSPADVAGLRPRDFIIAIDAFTKRGWEPNMIEVSTATRTTLVSALSSAAVSLTVTRTLVLCAVGCEPHGAALA